jgi:LmbE family N-acetylglucosaminyl deacetylase
MEHSKKTLVVLAHPDDEVFGPGGTLALWSKEGEVQLICVTDGGDERRQEELEASAKILGLKAVHHLGYVDGSLNHALYHEVAAKIQKFVEAMKPEVLMTFELKGISGHLDHVAVSMITSYVFRENKEIKELWYFGELEHRALRSFRDKYFIFFPRGYKKEEMDETVETGSAYATQVKAMMAHQTQRKDALLLIAQRALLPKREYFKVWKRD